MLEWLADNYALYRAFVDAGGPDSIRDLKAYIEGML